MAGDKANPVLVSDVSFQRQVLHDNAWMLKDELIGLDIKLFPVIDARPIDPSAEKPAESDDEYHCELANLIKDDAATVRECLMLVRSIASRLQV